ncbi:MAG: hypothetical protein KGL48_14430 [Sphingomonadales bacterium]|nr:hypothetical protein [Sphingomonadales bacterium]MDE2569221.1 hypothetical protein [Sphingomonadales bacterium]
MLCLALAESCAPAKLAEGRLRSALVDAGLSKGDAACMAERMTDRLTLAQVRKLEVLKTPKRTLPDYVYAVRRLGDAKLLGVTASSAALCESGLAPESR